MHYAGFHAFQTHRHKYVSHTYTHHGDAGHVYSLDVAIIIKAYIVTDQHLTAAAKQSQVCVAIHSQTHLH